MGSFSDCLKAVENKEYDILTHKIPPKKFFRNSNSSYKIYTKKNLTKSNSEKGIRNSNKQKNIDILSSIELCDIISVILRIQVPFFDNKHLQTLSSLSLITGNGPYHEGLIIITQNKNIYVTQVYPITFIKVMNIYEATSEIMSFNAFNANSKEYYISDIYIPQQPIIIMNIYHTVKRYPNRYSLFTENCQRFCNYIITQLSKKYKIERDNNPESTKMKYRKIKDSYKCTKEIKLQKIDILNRSASFKRINNTLMSDI